MSKKESMFQRKKRETMQLVGSLISLPLWPKYDDGVLQQFGSKADNLSANKENRVFNN